MDTQKATTTNYNLTTTILFNDNDRKLLNEGNLFFINQVERLLLHSFQFIHSFIHSNYSYPFNFIGWSLGRSLMKVILGSHTGSLFFFLLFFLIQNKLPRVPPCANSIQTHMRLQLRLCVSISRTLSTHIPVAPVVPVLYSTLPSPLSISSLLTHMDCILLTFPFLLFPVLDTPGHILYAHAAFSSPIAMIPSFPVCPSC